MDDLVNSCGNCIGTVETESALEAHAAVIQAPVVSQPLTSKEQVSCAFIILGSGFDESENSSQNSA
jgi:acetyl-CoA synthetase